MEIRDIVLIAIMNGFIFYNLLYPFTFFQNFIKRLESIGLGLGIGILGYGILRIVETQNIFARMAEPTGGHVLTWFILAGFYFYNYKSDPIAKTILLLILGEFIWNMTYMLYYQNFDFGIIIMLLTYAFIIILAILNLKRKSYGILIAALILVATYLSVWIWVFGFENTANWIPNPHYSNSLRTHLIETIYWLYFAVNAALFSKLYDGRPNYHATA
jgi:hypothetical protein